MTFSIASISTHTGTQERPVIAEDGTITTAADTSAGSYQVTITPDGSTYAGDPFTVDFYVTIKAADTADLDTKFKTAIANYGSTGDFNYIDTSAVTDMSYLFSPRFTPGTGLVDANRTYVTDFNGDISKWDVSSVENFTTMFKSATAFNQDIGGWDVSAVENFSVMFNNATAFNQDIGGWDVSAGTNFNLMFNGATTFNQDLSSWAVASNANKSNMFLNSGVTTPPSWYQ